MSFHAELSLGEPHAIAAALRRIADEVEAGVVQGNLQRDPDAPQPARDAEVSGFYVGTWDISPEEASA